MSERDKWQLAAWAAVIVVAAVLALKAYGAREEESGRPTRPAPAVSVREREEGRGAAIVVHVGGAVRRPGLVRVAEGARVARAVQRAGGPATDGRLDAINLAQKLEDGQQVIVPGRESAVSGSAGGAEGEEAGPVSLGSATAEDLEELDGIGPTLAERIIEYRDENGGFGSVDDLNEVDGIGEKRFESLSEAVAP